MNHPSLTKFVAYRLLRPQSTYRYFSTLESVNRVQESVISEKIVQGQKMHHYDGHINALLNVKEARNFYYTQVPKLQDHHFILLLQRLQQIQDLGELDSGKRKSLLLLNEKIFEKLSSRFAHFDCTDLLQLVRYLAKIKTTSHGSMDKIKFTQDAMIKIAERLQKPEMMHEIRLLYKFENWLSLMININLIYSNVLILSRVPLPPQAIDANKFFGHLFCDEMKHFQFKKSPDTPYSATDLLQVYDQLTRYQLESYSIVKEIQNKLANLVTSKDQQLQYLNIMTRVDMQHDAKVVERLARSVALNHVAKVTYQEMGQFLESLMFLQYKLSEDVSSEIVKELENRQRQLVAQAKEGEQGEQESKGGEKLPIQEALKIFRGIFHLGLHHELNQSQLLLRAFTNLIFKNREKMTTNQTTEALFMIRQTMLYPASQQINKRLIGLHGNVREQIELKIFKTSGHRILLMMLQDRFLKDSMKLINGSKEFKGNILKSILQQIDEMYSLSELNLITNIFSKDMFEEAKFVSLTLQQLSRRTHDLKEEMIKRKHKDYSKDIESINKLVYLVCAHESACSLSNQISPQLICGRDYWQEIQTTIQSLKAIGLFDKYPGDDYLKEISIFQNSVLENKFQITSLDIPEVQSQIGIAKSERIKLQLEEHGIKGIQTMHQLDINPTQTQKVDLYLQDKKVALKIMEHTKVEQDLRFKQDKNMLEEGSLLLTGDDKYTLSRQINQAYNEAQLSPIQQYCLKYFLGIEYKIIDPKRAKDEAYVKNVIKLM